MAVLNKVPIVTTITGANAAARAIAAMQKEDWGVKPLQEYFGEGQVVFKGTKGVPPAAGGTPAPTNMLFSTSLNSSDWYSITF